MTHDEVVTLLNSTTDRETRNKLKIKYYSILYSEGMQPMSSYMTRHRPICTVLDDARKLAEKNDDGDMIKLIDEAIDYARRMSKRLMEYKQKEMEVGHNDTP